MWICRFRYTSARQFASFLRKPVANPQHFQGRQSLGPYAAGFRFPYFVGVDDSVHPQDVPGLVIFGKFDTSPWADVGTGP